MQKLWYPCFALPCARLTPPLPSALCYPGLFLSITVLRCSGGIPRRQLWIHRLEAALQEAVSSKPGIGVRRRESGQEKRESAHPCFSLSSPFSGRAPPAPKPDPAPSPCHPWGAGPSTVPTCPSPGCLTSCWRENKVLWSQLCSQITMYLLKFNYQLTPRS